jgi:heptosyltransferase-1
MFNVGKPSGRILVVRLGAMGDIVHTLPAVASLKHSFPGWRLAWAVEPKWAPLLEDNPFIDDLLWFRRDGPAGWLENWRGLREHRYDFAVDFQGLMKSALVASAARPARLFGYHHSQLRERAAALFYSDKTESRSAHMVDRHLDLAASAGAASAIRAFPLPQGHPEGDLPREFVLASPLAGWNAKQWPIDYYRDLAALVRRECGLPLVLNGPPSAWADLAQIKDAVAHSSGIPGLIDATRRAVAVIGVDSGPLHLAAALGKPGVAIFGPTDPARNGPYGDSMRVLRSAGAVTTYKRSTSIDESMTRVSPSEVLETLRAVLGERRRAADCLI